MEQTKGQARALDILTRIEAGETRADIAKSYGVSESSIYFETRFGKFLRYREQHPDDRASIGAWGAYDKLWAKTDKKAPEQTRFAELICSLPLAADVPTKADKRSAKIAAVESAKPPRKSKAKPANGEASWPLASVAAAIIDAKNEPEPTPEPEPVAGGFSATALAALAEPTTDTPKDPIVAKREAKTAAQRIRRALAKARAELTAAAQ